MAVFPTTPIPSYGSKPQTKIRTLEAQFGDGYRQRAGDGLNAKQVTWEVFWDRITKAQADTLRAFLDARNGYEAFDWTPPGTGEVQGKYSCTGYEGPSPVGYDSYSFRATFRKEFDL